jgi:salicylate hydroxylase
MTSFIPEGSVRFGKRVESITQADGVATLAFGDGTVERHAAVIGCDDVKGISRRVVLGSRYPEYVEPRYTGKYVYRAVLSMTEAKEIMGDLATDAKMFMGKGANLSTYPISEGREVNVVAFKRDEQPWKYPDFTYDVAREDMMSDLEDNKPDARLLKLLNVSNAFSAFHSSSLRSTKLLRLTKCQYAKPVRWGIFHHPDTPTYYNSLICLLGDVAHAGGPHQGAGAGQCLEDAFILPRVLGKLYHSNKSTLLSPPSGRTTALIEAAFQAYDEVRRPRAQKQVQTTHCCGEIYNFFDPIVGVDIVRIVENMNSRFAWIWEHDLDADVSRAERRLDDLISVRKAGRNLSTEESARL